MIIGYDAKRIVNNNTGLGSYGRNLINSLVPLLETNDKLLLYTPSFGNEQLRSQVIHSNQVQYVYPQNASNGLMRTNQSKSNRPLSRLIGRASYRHKAHQHGSSCNHSRPYFPSSSRILQPS